MRRVQFPTSGHGDARLLISSLMPYQLATFDPINVCGIFRIWHNDAICLGLNGISRSGNPVTETGNHMEVRMALSLKIGLKLMKSSAAGLLMFIPLAAIAQAPPFTPTQVKIVAPVPVPISGNVNVLGTPNVQIMNTTPVPISGAVSVQGTPSVALQNSQLNPIYTKDANLVSRTPFRWTQVFPFQPGDSSSEVVHLVPPTGTRIHVESLYCRFGMPIGVVGISAVTGQTVKPAWEANFCRNAGGGTEFCYSFISEGVLFESLGFYEGAVAHSTSLTLDSGEPLVVSVKRNPVEGTFRVAYCNLNGFSEPE